MALQKKFVTVYGIYKKHWVIHNSHLHFSPWSLWLVSKRWNYQSWCIQTQGKPTSLELSSKHSIGCACEVIKLLPLGKNYDPLQKASRQIVLNKFVESRARLGLSGSHSKNPLANHNEHRIIFQHTEHSSNEAWSDEDLQQRSCELIHEMIGFFILSQVAV